MFIFKENESLQRYIQRVKRTDSQVGFVPTMGALHQGHISLIRAAKESCDVVICSIFVNPTQFNDATDLEKYPRTIQNDISLLVEASTDVLYLPTVQSIYPKGTQHQLSYHLGGLDALLEGAFRPGHFQGVANVVHRFLDIVRPDALFMGQKDYQQVAVIRHVIRQKQIPTRLVMVPTKRASSGLALSSRNALLTDHWKAQAITIYQTLKWAKEQVLKMPIQSLQDAAIAKLEDAGLRPEYFSIIDGDSLQPVKKANPNKDLVAVTAAWAGDVRLIDNMVLHKFRG